MDASESLTIKNPETLSLNEDYLEKDEVLPFSRVKLENGKNADVQRHVFFQTISI